MVEIFEFIDIFSDLSCENSGESDKNILNFIKIKLLQQLR